MNRRRPLGILFAITFLIASAARPAAAAEKNSAAKWPEKMQELYKTLVDTMTDASSDARFNDPKNNYRILNNAKRLSSLAHELNKRGMAPAQDADPTIKIVAHLFADEAKRAASAIETGNKGYARSILLGMTGYCVACHTRNGSGPQFGTLPFEPSAQDLKPVERGRFFAATRQYDKALEVFMATPSTNPIEWELATRYALAIAVRVKGSPELAGTIVDRIIASKTTPYFLKQDAIAWHSQIQDWKAEPARAAKTEEGLRAEAIRLTAKAHELQKYPADHSADITYLRASAAVHDLMQSFPDGKYASDAYLMAGMSYEVLRSLNVDDLHEIYYEGCVRKSPHTPTALTCYQRLEQSVFEGFSGSAGLNLPEDVMARLKELSELASPADGGKLN